MSSQQVQVTFGDLRKLMQLRRQLSDASLQSSIQQEDEMIAKRNSGWINGVTLRKKSKSSHGVNNESGEQKAYDPDPSEIDLFTSSHSTLPAYSRTHTDYTDIEEWICSSCYKGYKSENEGGFDDMDNIWYCNTCWNQFSANENESFWDKETREKFRLDLWIRRRWKVGSKVEVYSVSEDIWHIGTVKSIMDDEDGEWMEVEYKYKGMDEDEENEELQIESVQVIRGNKSFIRPLSKAMKIYKYIYDSITNPDKNY